MLKIVMAVTGFALAGFVLGHMVGHLQMFLGRDAYNGYAHFLKHDIVKLLWIARLSLLACVALHVAAAAYLSNLNRAARPRGYRVVKHQRTSVFARTMMWSGLTVLAFVIYHVLHFTLGVVHGEHFAQLDPSGRPDVFNNFVLSFQDPLIFGAYVVANCALAGHLSHALSSMFKTLGLSTGRFKGLFEPLGPAFAGVCLLGFLLPPLACFTGTLNPQYEVADAPALSSSTAQR